MAYEDKAKSSANKGGYDNLRTLWVNGTNNAKYGTVSLFVPLTDLVETYPNLTSEMLYLIPKADLTVKGNLQFECCFDSPEGEHVIGTYFAPLGWTMEHVKASKADRTFNLHVSVRIRPTSDVTSRC